MILTFFILFFILTIILLAIIPIATASKYMRDWE